MKKIIYFVTSNDGKLREAREILKGHDIKSIKMDLPELQGEPREIAAEKARIACRIARKPVFVEDTSLCFDALGGLPGPYIKHFEKKMGYENVVRMLDSFNDKNAVAITVVGYCEPGKEPEVFSGTINGRIVHPAGKNSFGWDIIFIPEGHDKRFSEMDPEEKNRISHRRKAFEKFRKFLERKG